MELYPALKGRMGEWDFYMIKMSMSELGGVKYAHEIYDDYVLDDAIQRALKEGRVRDEIVTYLQRQPYRFFSSIVIAALDGNPIFYPVEVADDPKFQLFQNDKRFNETFGVLHFDGGQTYYALDGQHRLAAIRSLLHLDQVKDPPKPPKGFAHEEMSVIAIVPNSTESKGEFLKRYRRLFSNLNRYAKPTDQATNIIMDEDDTFAILTRRLITDHEFFKSPGKEKASPRIKTTSGKNLREGDSFFTSIESLYDITIRLLDASWRQGKFGSDGGEKRNDFSRFRPEESYIEDLYKELCLYWDGLLAELPVLRAQPSNMRSHSFDDYDEPDSSSAEEVDHLLFWPIGQQMLADLVRMLLDRRQKDPQSPTKASVQRALSGLSKLEWRLHWPPWRYYLLAQEPERAGRPPTWKIRDSDRKKVANEGLYLQMWLIGEDDYSVAEENEARIRWASRLVPAQGETEDKKMWSEIKAIRAHMKS